MESADPCRLVWRWKRKYLATLVAPPQEFPVGTKSRQEERFLRSRWWDQPIGAFGLEHSGTDDVLNNGTAT